MSIKQWNILLFLALLAVLSGGGYVLYQSHLGQEAARIEKLEQERLAEEELRLEEEKAAHLVVLTQGFEDFLNKFLQDVSRETKEYRKTRKVLVGLIEPANLRSPEYIEENYNLGEASVMSLRLQMDKIMGLFEEAELLFQAQLAKWPEGRGDVISQSWVKMKEKQVNLYLAYFTSEQDLLAAMQELLAFYHERRDVLYVDIGAGRIVLEDEDDIERHATLKAQVDELSAMQAEFLSQ